MEIAALRFEALGGECELYAIDPAEPLEATADWIRGLHRQLTRFEPDSELSRFNARAGEWVAISSELQQLLDAALDAYVQSDGLVNAAVLPALIAAGYDRTWSEVAARERHPRDRNEARERHPRERNEARDGHPRDRSEARERHPRERNEAREGRPRDRGDAAAREAGPRGSTDGAARTGGPRSRTERAASEGARRDLDRIGPRLDRFGSNSAGARIDPLPQLLEVRLGEARLSAGAAIDLGGLAKGWIADRGVERLGANSLVNCAGDLHARGGGETGEGWPVGFSDRTLLLKDLAAATSGTTGRRWGDGRHHLIDPRTGAPARSDLSEVSVLATTALEAEVLAKTALLLGSALAPAYLEPRSRGWALS